MSRRVLIGRKNNGSFGMSVSLPGVDARDGDINGGGFSFDDSWTDIIKLAMISTVTVASSDQGVQDVQVVPHGLGYVPFIESRIISGSTIFDDYVNISNVQLSNPYSGGLGFVTSSSLTFRAIQSRLSSPAIGQLAGYTGFTAVYAVYATPVPNPS